MAVEVFLEMYLLNSQLRILIDHSYFRNRLCCKREVSVVRGGCKGNYLECS